MLQKVKTISAKQQHLFKTNPKHFSTNRKKTFLGEQLSCKKSPSRISQRTKQEPNKNDKEIQELQNETKLLKLPNINNNHETSENTPHFNNSK